VTGQGLLDRMELVNQELQLQTGEADTARGLLALNVAQDYFESLAALRGKIFGSGIGTVTATTAESTTYPSGLLRIDRLQLIGTNSLPSGDLRRLQRAGGQASSSFWPLNLTLTSGTGSPRAYWTNGSAIFWQPIPNASYTVRYYGFVAAADITAGGTFAYPDIVALPLAAFAAKLMKLGVDDDPAGFDGLAQQTFGTTLDALSLANRDGAVGLEYKSVHTE
jgi:hypothetical protein